SKKETALAGSNPCDITEDEIPFDIPESWCWCRWGDLSESIQYGYNAPAKETGRIKMVRISDIHENKVFWDSVPYCNISEDEIQTYILKKNDILFARTGGTVGKSFLVQDVPCEAIYAGYLIRTHYNSEKLVPQYLKFFMESNLYWEQLKEGTIATAQPNCNGKTLSKMLIPLPPLAEQKRIVSELEKFMPLIEEYGKKETQLKAINEKIGTLTKKAILQEAVQGKLVPQIASEGNARDLLEDIRKEKLSHGLDFANAKSGKRKSKKETALAGSNPCDITEEEIPFDIPENWCWCRLGEVTEIARGGSPRPIKDYLTTDESGYNWIKIGDTDKNGKYINQTAEKIVKEGLSKTRLVHKGDFLLTNSMSFGRPYILNIDGCIHDGWLVISPKGTVFDKDFLYYVLSSTFAYNQFCDSVSGAVVKNLNSDKVRESLLPLPPLAEQKRIVAAIEKMLPLCEKLGE
ncbi:restriction endonuclease subunit S, partial [uncultured Treponema sp.]|uniref:restriction endonuclease subunit S n=1 Tax=uncultured Treponema sp. TaxID=162155 RepID=UPI0028057219